MKSIVLHVKILLIEYSLTGLQMWEYIAWIHIVIHAIDKVLDKCESSHGGDEARLW